MVLKYEDIQPTCPAPGITRRILAHGGGMMGVEASFQKGAVGEAHRHPHEQVSYILSGCFEYEVEGQKYILHKGDSYYVAPDLLHGAVALEEGVILDIFTPQRTDFLWIADTDSRGLERDVYPIVQYEIFSSAGAT